MPGYFSYKMRARKYFLPAFAILVISFLASYILHLMIADLALKTSEGGQIIACLSQFLFRGKVKKILSALFFILMTLILFTNLAAYISGSEEILAALNKTTSGRLHRIEHCEFHNDESLEELKKLRYAVMMQPGYAWIDKRYLNTYTQFLPQEIVDRLRFKTLYDAGVCLCGSSDSPVQAMDPWLQMLGMVDFYNPEESITPYEAFRCYTLNPARAILEEDERGTLEVGKAADFLRLTKTSLHWIRRTSYPSDRYAPTTEAAPTAEKKGPLRSSHGLC